MFENDWNLGQIRKRSRKQCRRRKSRNGFWGIGSRAREICIAMFLAVAEVIVEMKDASSEEYFNRAIFESIDQGTEYN